MTRGEGSPDKSCRRKKRNETIKNKVDGENEEEEMDEEGRLGGKKTEREEIKAGGRTSGNKSE